MKVPTGSIANLQVNESVTDIDLTVTTEDNKEIVLSEPIVAQQYIRFQFQANAEYNLSYKCEYTIGKIIWAIVR